MAWSIGLHLGESVVEMTGRSSQNPEAPLIKHRAFYPQGSPGTALNAFLQKNNITSDVERVDIVTQLPIKILEAGYGSPIAVLTTLGFENWLEMNLPIKQTHFTNQPEKHNFFIDRELIFGLNERTNASGHIEKLIEDTELEFLVSKLKMHEIKNVALCFLHSKHNNENEKRAQQYLATQGFQVYTSSQYNSQDEKARFWTAITNAYTNKYYVEILTHLKNELDKVAAPQAIIKIGEYALQDVIENKICPLDTAFSMTDAIGQRFAKTTDLLYCGIEDILFFKGLLNPHTEFKSSWIKLCASHWPFLKLRLQPHTRLGKGFFSELTYTDEKNPIDPGPMLFGRGLNLTLFDHLFLTAPSGTVEISGLNEKIQDKGRQRLNESLAVYARNMKNSETISGNALAHNLLILAAELWLGEMFRNSTSHTQSITLCGPLAPVVQKWIGGQVIGDDFFVSTSLIGASLGAKL